MSVEFIFRIVGMFVLFLVGGYWGFWFAGSNGLPTFSYMTGMAFVGALIGLVITPFITSRPVRALRSALAQVSAEQLFSGLLGLVMGLIIAALLTLPLSRLPAPFGDVMPFVGVLLFGYFGVAIFVTRQNDMLSVFSSLTNRGEGVPATAGSWTGASRTILLDTSVIIDGRVGDVAKTGFLPGTLLIPRFVLNELQYIADSSDSLRRQRGRRGMEVLSELQKTPLVSIRITDMDVEGVREVDDKLVILARQMKCPILTNDYNLNRIAELQGVSILNINELSNAVKSVVLPGETFNVHVLQEGKEYGQGVGYLEDGTMVVVEGGNKHLGMRKSVTVTKVLQTAAGRMIFAHPDD